MASPGSLPSASVDASGVRRSVGSQGAGVSFEERQTSDAPGELTNPLFWLPTCGHWAAHRLSCQSASNFGHVR
jgi:hypothetical protein